MYDLVYCVMIASTQTGTDSKMSEQLLSPRQLADYLNVPLSTLYRWHYHGEGPPGFRVGKPLPMDRCPGMGPGSARDRAPTAFLASGTSHRPASRYLGLR